MYRPTVYRNGFLDDFFNVSLPQTFQAGFDRIERKGLMKTDICEKENGYEMTVELPGYSKDQIEIMLDNGTLTVKAASREDASYENGSYLHRERYTGEATRTFFVGKDVKEKDIRAHFENGVLTLEFPKEEESKKLITID